MRLKIIALVILYTLAAVSNPARSATEDSESERGTIAALPAVQEMSADLPEIVEGKLGAEIDAEASKAAKAGFSGAVLVAKSGKILLRKGYGLANRERNIAAKSDTVFDVGSLAKMFTAAAIYKLEQQGKLSTDDTLTKFFNHVGPDKTGITLYQLLKHTSGLKEYHGTQGDFEEMTKDAAVNEILAQKLQFEPGKQFAYSNAGYTLLAAVVEKASGRSFQTYVREELFDPAGMSRTGFYGNSRWHDENVARGYNADKVEKDNSPLTWTHVTWALMGSGGVGTTVGDLYKWRLTLKGTALLSEETKGKYFVKRSIKGTAGGTEFGFFALFFEYVDDDVAVVIASNSSKGQVPALQSKIAGLVTTVQQPSGDGVRNGRDGAEGTKAQSGAIIISDGPAAAAARKLPDTPAGRVAASYLKAFNSGDDKVMKEFFVNHLSMAAQTARPIEARLNFYRQVREMGELEIDSVVADDSQSVILKAHSRSGKSLEVHFEMDAAEPQKLKAFRIELM